LRNSPKKREHEEAKVEKANLNSKKSFSTRKRGFVKTLIEKVNSVKTLFEKVDSVKTLFENAFSVKTLFEKAV
jgi:hypothetical protein